MFYCHAIYLQNKLLIVVNVNGTVQWVYCGILFPCRPNICLRNTENQFGQLMY